MTLSANLGNQTLRFDEVHWILLLLIGSYIMVKFGSKVNSNTIT